MRRLAVIALVLTLVAAVGGCVRVFSETKPQMTVRNMTGQEVTFQQQVGDGKPLTKRISDGQKEVIFLSVEMDGCSPQLQVFVVVAKDGRRTAPRTRFCDNNEWIITPSDLNPSPRPS